MGKRELVAEVIGRMPGISRCEIIRQTGLKPYSVQNALHYLRTIGKCKYMGNSPRGGVWYHLQEPDSIFVGQVRSVWDLALK